MAKKAGLAQKFYQGAFDLSGDVSAISSWSTPVGVLDVTGISSSAMERVQGIVDGSMSYNVFFNDAAGAAHLASRVPTAAAPMTWAIGQTVGDVAGMVASVATNYDGSRSADGALSFDITAMNHSTPPVWGVMLTAGSKTDTGAANGASLDQSAQTSAGAEAILHVTSFTGSNFTATVQDSSDDSSWGTLKAFTQVTGTGSERVTVSGTVERYVRVISTGTFNPVTFAVSFRRGTATDRTAYA
jgi:hypothetical protein